MDLAFNNLQWLIRHKTQQTKPNYVYKQMMVGWFYGTSTYVGNLRPNPLLYK